MYHAATTSCQCYQLQDVCPRQNEPSVWSEMSLQPVVDPRGGTRALWKSLKWPTLAPTVTKLFAISSIENCEHFTIKLLEYFPWQILRHPHSYLASSPWYLLNDSLNLSLHQVKGMHCRQHPSRLAPWTTVFLQQNILELLWLWRKSHEVKIYFVQQHPFGLCCRGEFFWYIWILQS